MSQSRSSRQPAPSSGRPAGGWVHFGVAVGILLAATTGFHAAVNRLKIHLVKEPVPWPKGVEVCEHRLESFPRELGPYVLVADGEITARRDGEPDGLLKLRDEQIKELGIAEHSLNWYYTSVYRDTRVPGTYRDRAGRYIQLDVTYYTGLVDPVPHVPEICLFAGGHQLLVSESGPLSLEIPGVPPPWNRIQVRRTAYGLQQKDGSVTKSAQYHIFSMNGSPTHSRGKIRAELSLPWEKYCYYAKIQMATPWPEPSLAAGDAVCREFLAHAIPAVLRFLPMAGDVERLKQSK